MFPRLAKIITTHLSLLSHHERHLRLELLKDDKYIQQDKIRLSFFLRLRSCPTAGVRVDMVRARSRCSPFFVTS